MRNISFALTKDQIRNRTKTVTRRLGWKNLKPGTLLQGCEKCQGLKRGEGLTKIAVIRVVSVRREPLNLFTRTPVVEAFAEVTKEGFPRMLPSQFVEMFCEHMKCKPSTVVTRIEFEYVATAANPSTAGAF